MHINRTELPKPWKENIFRYRRGGVNAMGKVVRRPTAFDHITFASAALPPIIPDILRQIHGLCLAPFS